MKKKILFQVLGCLMIGVIGFSQTGIAIAASTSSLNSDLSSINESIEDKQHQKDEVEAERKNVMEEVEELIYQISDYESQIAALDDELTILESNIAEAEANIAKEEENYKQLNEATQDRITAIYEAGETTFLDMLLSSESILDFISNYYLASLVTEADTAQLEEIEKKRNEIETAKEELENDKQKVEETKANKEKTTEALNQAKEIKDQMAADLSEQERQLQIEIEEFVAEKNAIEEELKRIAEEEAKQNGGYTTLNPSSAGYISPIPGTTRNSITCGFYGYSGHGGADFGGHYGEPVVAVKAGTVIKSKTTYGSIPNYDANGNYIGSYSSYGEYIIINHHDGTMTLYAHGKPGSRLVQEGETVSQGQQIMTVGNTGNVFPRPSSSSPRNGAHLHFEVRVNGTSVNPYAYLP